MADISKREWAGTVGAGVATGAALGVPLHRYEKRKEARLWELDRIAKEKAAVREALQARIHESRGSFSVADAQREHKIAYARIEQESADRLASLSENFDWAGNPRYGSVSPHHVEAAPGAPSPAPEAPKAGRGAPAAAAPKAPSSPQLKIVGDRVWLDAGGRKIVAVQYGDEPPRIFMSSSGTSQAVGQPGHVGKGNWFETKGVVYDARHGRPIYGKGVLDKTPIPGSSGEAIADELNYGQYGQGLEPTHRLNIDNLDETVDFNDWVKTTTGTNESFAVGKKGQVIAPIDRAQADSIRQNGWRWPAAEAAKTPTKDPQWKGATAEALVEETPTKKPPTPKSVAPEVDTAAGEHVRRLRASAQDRLDDRPTFGEMIAGEPPPKAPPAAAPSAPLTEETLPQNLRDDPSLYQTASEKQAMSRSGVLEEPRLGAIKGSGDQVAIDRGPGPLPPTDNRPGPLQRKVVMNPAGEVPAPPERMAIPPDPNDAYKNRDFSKDERGVWSRNPNPPDFELPEIELDAPPKGGWDEVPEPYRSTPDLPSPTPDMPHSTGPKAPRLAPGTKKILKGAGKAALIGGGVALAANAIWEGNRAVKKLGESVKEDGVIKGSVTGPTRVAGDFVGETGGAIEAIGDLAQYRGRTNEFGDSLPPGFEPSGSQAIDLGGRALSAAGRGLRGIGRGIEKGGRWWAGERASPSILEMADFEGLEDSEFSREFDREIAEAKAGDEEAQRAYDQKQARQKAEQNRSPQSGYNPSMRPPEGTWGGPRPESSKPKSPKPKGPGPSIRPTRLREERENAARNALIGQAGGGVRDI